MDIGTERRFFEDIGTERRFSLAENVAVPCVLARLYDESRELFLYDEFAFDLFCRCCLVD